MEAVTMSLTSAAETLATGADRQLTARIGAFMSRSFQGRQFGADDEIFSLGFGNSLFAIQLVAFVEREFGIEIGSEDLDMENFHSIQAIANLVERKLAVSAGK
jgi:methoxymalonate biosynthesis acyl carrier protein